MVTTVVAGVSTPAAQETPAKLLAVKESALIAPVRVRLVARAAPAGTRRVPFDMRSWPAVKPDVGVVFAVRVAVAVPLRDMGRGFAAEIGAQEVTATPLVVTVIGMQMDAWV